ncbi:unnamed protein product [Lupinus luteus]|uniref:Aminotransferase-like plant mobile domain-containing protein n=1 Tax=Lupinus luteus TaxID=3873 RepID=A0AAV1VPV8_LUPLU
MRWSQHLITTYIPGHAANIIRRMLDCLQVDQFLWTPYRAMNIRGQVPDICRARVPLICFATVEWHAADRVMRQFGLQQPILQDPPKFDKLHKMDLCGKHDCNWPQKHEVWIQLWDSQDECVVNGIPQNQPLYHQSQYMEWYLQRTRRYISPDGAYSVGAFNFANDLFQRTSALQAYNNPIQTIDYVHFQCKGLLNALAELNPTFNTSRTEAPPTQHFNMPAYESEPEPEPQPQPHPPHFSSPHFQGEQPYGGFTTFPPNYHMGQSSQFQESLPSMFATSSHTPTSAYGSQDYY